MNRQMQDMLLFEVGGQLHALAADEVRELLPALACAPMLGSADWCEGAIDVRGSVMPLVSARRRFGLPAKEPALADHFIVIGFQDRLAALHVDRAVELVHVAEHQVAPLESGRMVKWQDALVPLHRAADFFAGAEAVP